MLKPSLSYTDFDYNPKMMSCLKSGSGFKRKPLAGKVGRLFYLIDDFFIVFSSLFSNQRAIQSRSAPMCIAF